MAKLDQKQLLETLSDIARCGSQRDYDDSWFAEWAKDVFEDLDS